MKIFEELKRATSQTMTLEELIGAFEQMCKTPIDGVDEYDDMVLFETSTYRFEEISSFQFSLVRQFPNEDEEYVQIHLDISYPLDAQGKLMTQAIWSEDIDGDFFEYVKNSDAYLSLKSTKIDRINVFIDET